MTGRVLAVDPGAKRIGIAISDETATLARGLLVIEHVSLMNDCSEISWIAQKENVVTIIVGNATGIDGEERSQTRHARKVAEELAERSGLPVNLWDEYGSTQKARSIRMEIGASKSKRGGHLDADAAAVILQSWLDAHHTKE